MFGFFPYSGDTYAGAGAASSAIAVNGVEATGAVGSVTITGDAVVNLTGVAATGAIGTIEVNIPKIVDVTGVEATGGVGDVTVVGDAIFSVTGVSGTAQLGTPTIEASAQTDVTGVTATGEIGDITVTGDAVVDVTGVEATGAVGDVTVAINVDIEVTGVSAEALTQIVGSPFTADGNAQLSTAQAKFGSASLLLDGTDDFVTSDDNIDLSSGDFTVDMWIRPTSVTGYKGLWQSGTSSLLNVYLIGDQVQGTVAGSTTLFLSSTRISANVWTMISVEREGSVHRLYINGVLEQSSSTGNRPDDGVFAIGRNGFGDFNGYIDELRLSSVARYGGTSFTEPTANYEVDADTTALLHFDGTNGSTDIINETDRGVIVEADANVDVTGVEATGAIGEVTATGSAVVEPTGLAATGAVGQVTVQINITVDVTGVAATGEVGDVAVSGSANVLPVGVEGDGVVGTVIVWGGITPSPGTTWSEIDPTDSTTWSDVSPNPGTTWTDIAA